MPAANVRRRGMGSPKHMPADVLRQQRGISGTPGPGARGSSGSRIRVANASPANVASATISELMSGS
jgi:hypothetical protein